MLIESLESRVHLSLSGDANGDHRVDSLDFNIVALHYNAAAAGIAQGDFNADAKCNALDFNVLAGEFGQQEIHMDTWNGPNNDPWETDADWLDGTKPTALDGVTIPDTPWPANPVAPTTVLSLTTIDADGTSRNLSNLSFGDGNINGINGLSVNAVSGSVSGESNQGALTIASLTGVGKDLDVVAGSVVVTSFAANADYAIGGSTPSLDNLTINGGATTSIVRFTGSSQGGSPGASINNWHGKIITEKVGVTACNVNLVGSSLESDATFESINGGKAANYTQPITSTDFTPSWAENAQLPVGTVISVVVSAARVSTGFVPTGFTDGQTTGFNWNAGTRTASATIGSSATTGTNINFLDDTDSILISSSNTVVPAGDITEATAAPGDTVHFTYAPTRITPIVMIDVGSSSATDIVDNGDGTGTCKLALDNATGAGQAVVMTTADWTFSGGTLTVTAAGSGPGSVFGRTVVPAGMESIVLPQAIRDADSDLIDGL